MKRKITRRTFLGLTVLLPSVSRASAQRQHQPVKLGDRQSSPIWLAVPPDEVIEAVVGPLLSVVTIGETCRKSSVSSVYSAWSRQFINELSALVSRMGEHDYRTYRTRYQQQVKAEFAVGRTLSVNGYILSQTEVEMCHWAAALKLIHG